MEKSKKDFKTISTLILMFYGAQVGAAKVQVLGSGEVVGAPDQVSFAITIQALCYPTVQEASASADQVASDIFSKLSQIFPKKDKLNAIITQGGFTQAYFPIRYPDNKSNDCQHTFQKTTTIQVMSTEMASFETLFNKVQEMIYASYQSNNDNVLSKASTFVTMNQPNAQLSFDKNQAMEMNALAAALQNATEKAKKLVGEKNAAALKIGEIAESGSGPSPVFRPMMKMQVVGDMAASAPVAFENNTVNKTLSVVFEY